jgi:hypothetical protein
MSFVSRIRAWGARRRERAAEKLVRSNESRSAANQSEAAKDTGYKDFTH